MRRSPLLAAVAAALALAGCGGDGGVPEDGPVLGEDGPVLAVFTSVGCDECAEVQRRAVPQVVREQVEPGNARIRVALLTPPDDGAAALTNAIRAAGLQDRLFAALDAAFATPAPRDAEALFAAIEGLDVEEAREALRSPELADAAKADQRLIDRYGIDATPTVLLGPGEDELQPVEAPNLSARELTYAVGRAAR